MHPGHGVRAFAGIKWRADPLTLVDEAGKEHGLRLAETTAGSVNGWRTDYGGLELVAVLLSCGLDDFVNVLMQFADWTGSDCVDVVDIGPDFGVELAEMRWVAPV